MAARTTVRILTYIHEEDGDFDAFKKVCRRNGGEAKVRCNAKTNNEVHFTTVYEPNEKRDAENARFTKATPWGDIKMGIDNPSALEQFEVNKEYFVDFTPAQ